MLTTWRWYKQKSCVIISWYNVCCVLHDKAVLTMFTTCTGPICLCQCWQVLQLVMCLTSSSGMNRRMWPFLHMLVSITILQLRIKVCTCLSTRQGVEFFCYNTRYAWVICDIPPSFFLLVFLSQAHSFVLVIATLSCCTYIILQNYCAALLCCCLLVCHHRHLR